MSHLKTEEKGQLWVELHRYMVQIHLFCISISVLQSWWLCSERYCKTSYLLFENVRWSLWTACVTSIIDPQHIISFACLFSGILYLTRKNTKKYNWKCDEITKLQKYIELLHCPYSRNVTKCPKVPSVSWIVNGVSLLTRADAFMSPAYPPECLT